MPTAVPPPHSPPTLVKPVPDAFRSITPHLCCAGAAQAIAFYQQAFDAIEVTRLAEPEGRLMHASVRIGDSLVMLVDEFPEMGSFGPKTLKGSPVTIHLYVPNVDEVYAHALAAGAVAVMPVSNMFWGDRYGVLRDPFGHLWSIATHIRDLTADEIRAAASGAAGCRPD